jgi:carboxylesterase
LRPVTAPHEQDDMSIDPSPIAWGDGERGVLLLHGLTGTPYEVRPFANALARRGFAVRAPRLAGHDDVGALEAVTWREWYAGAEAAFDELRDGGRRRTVVLGFSLGALLGLRLAALRPRELSGLVSVSVPLSMPPWQRGAITALARLRRHPWVGGLVGALPKAVPDVRIEREVRGSPSLRAFPFPALAQLVALQEDVGDLLPLVRAPLLLLHGAYDHVAAPENSARVAQRVGSSTVRRILLPSSFHIVALDLDRARACAEVVEFVTTALGDPLSAPTPPETP